MTIQFAFFYGVNQLKIFLQKISNLTDKVTYVVSALSRVSRALGHIVSNLFELTHGVLRAVPWIANILMVISSSIKVFNALTTTSDNQSSHFVKLAASIIKIGLGIASIVLMSLTLFNCLLPLIIASISTEIVLNIFLIGELIYSRFVSTWKKEKNEHAALKNEMIITYHTFVKTKKKLAASLKNSPTDISRQQALSQDCEYLKGKIVSTHNKMNTLKNKERDHYRDIADRTHLTLIAAASLTGAALLLTPAALLGAGILITAAVYSICVNLDINPIKWLTLKIFGDPFQITPAITDFSTIAAKIEMKNNKTNTPKPKKQKNSSTTHMYQVLEIKETEVKTTAKDNTKEAEFGDNRKNTNENEIAPTLSTIVSCQPSLSPK